MGTVHTIYEGRGSRRPADVVLYVWQQEFEVVEKDFLRTHRFIICEHHDHLQKKRDNDMTAAEKKLTDRNSKRVEIIESLLEDYRRKP